MLNMFEVIETNNMIEQEKLDVRTITMGISLLDCCDNNLEALNQKIYDKIYGKAKDLVSTGDAIARDFGVPIEQENFRDADRAGWRLCLQIPGGFRQHCPDP